MGKRHNSDLDAKVALRRKLLEHVADDAVGRYFLPFCGFGELMGALGYPADRCLAIDNDGAAVDHWTEHWPAAMVRNRHLDRLKTWGFEGGGPFVFADIDPYSNPWPVVQRFLVEAPLADTVAIAVTEGVRFNRGVKRMYYDFERHELVKHSVRADEQAANIAAEALHWLQGLAAARGYDVEEVAAVDGGGDRGKGVDLFGYVLRRSVPLERIGAPSSAKSFLHGLGDGTIVHGLSDGSWDLSDIILAAAEITGPADLAVVSWTAHPDHLEKLFAAERAGRFRSVRVLVDESWATMRARDDAAGIKERHKGQIRAWRAHAKVTVLTGGRFDVLIKGSANLTTNPRVEDYSVFGGGPAPGMYQAAFDSAFEGRDTKAAAIIDTQRRAAVAQAESEGKPLGFMTEDERINRVLMVHAERIAAFTTSIAGKRTRKAERLERGELAKLLQRHGLSNTRIGKVLGCHHTTVANDLAAWAVRMAKEATEDDKVLRAEAAKTYLDVIRGLLPDLYSENDSTRMNAASGIVRARTALDKLMDLPVKSVKVEHSGRIERGAADMTDDEVDALMERMYPGVSPGKGEDE